MKMLLMVECPNEPFNSLVRAGTVGEVIERILAGIKPLEVYFTEQDGRRGAILLIDVQDPCEIPSFSEPFFLHFNATCKFRIVLNPQDLQKAGLETLGQKWG
ncbi:panthothenate synthetase [Pseudomonas sp. PCH199]|uniref:panthothenate synthetase n=1 Tax=unclassified Pseudomonas TaxID=196821 RepID=UPI000BC7E055|nr:MULTISPECIES: panthothenate synthetase [unclassified Pseudomonas]MCW8277327.1 panthothenate synthetase [Pseudomonas sp. PCH199]PAM82535.1 panthothenate synthetase [Pseudomonas sp. ERMR1:02]